MRSPITRTIAIVVVVLPAIILLLLAPESQASTFITNVLTHPDHPNKCWHAETQTALEPGRIVDIPYQCVQIVCTRDLRLSGTGCSQQETRDENCHKVAGNRRLTYPNCCPSFECVDTERNTIT